MVRRLLFLLLVCAPCTRAHAQSIHGRLLDSDSAPAPAGALVTLVDARGRTVAKTVSGASGRFSLATDSAGSYTLRVLRIGYGATDVSVVLQPGERLEQTLILTMARVTLREVSVEGEAMCGTRTAGDSLASVLWGQVSTALALANESIRSKDLRFQTVLQAWTLSGLQTDSAAIEAQGLGVFNTAWPVQSPPPDSLRKNGFILNREDVVQGPTWFGPDAEFLLSDLFFSSHCFVAVPPSPDVPQEWIGLAFRPTKKDRRSDVEGTIWVDRASAQLRRVDYGYTRVPSWAKGRTAGGRLTFVVLESGDWIAQRWYMIVPVPFIKRPSYTAYFDSYLKSTGFVWIVSDEKGREIARFTQ